VCVTVTPSTLRRDDHPPSGREELDHIPRLKTIEQYKQAVLAAAQARFDQVYGGMLPEDKLRRVEELIAQHKIVAMIGDGINDAPALARSQVGVAMGSGTAVARESANVVAARLKALSSARNCVSNRRA